MIFALSTFLAGCGGSFKEASVELDLTKLRTLLNAIEPLISKGFGEAQISQIENDFKALARNESKRITFPVVYNGAETELRVLVRKEDVDAVEIRFSSDPRLAEQIQQAIRTTPLDVELTR